MTNDTIKKALKELSRRSAGYRIYEEYYKGKHQLCFASETFRNAFGDLFRKFADNLMPAVIDAVKDKLQVTGFVVEEGDDRADAAWEIWQRNRMHRQATEVHQEALRAGDAYVIVWPDAKGKARIVPNKAALCAVTYDEEEPGKIVSAVKVWITTGQRVRLNLYYADRIEKYITRNSYPNGLPDGAAAFQQFEAPGEEWPLQNPYGVVPVFHFANNASVGEAGQSELTNVIPLQDALNKAVLDKMVAMEYFAFPQRYAIGLEVDTDPVTNKPIAPWTGVERMLTIGSPDAKFGQFTAGDLSQFLSVQDSFRAEIARVSGTPMHYLMLHKGDFPSGEAMKTAEARFLAKVRDRQTSFGGEWENVVALALRIEEQADQDLQLFVQWSDPAPVSQKEQLESLTIKQGLGVSETQLLTEAGYGMADITRMQTERAAQESRAVADFNAE